MNIKTLLHTIEQHVPFTTAESWDNVGLLIGDKQAKISGVLTALDCTIEVVDEAISKGLNTIICHHPLIFKGIKSVVEQDGYGAIIRKIIKHDINLIALHTNLDVYSDGVNKMLADKMNLTNLKPLNSADHYYYKVQVYVPQNNVKSLKQNLSEHGLAEEGNYEYCFFESAGTGNFKPVDGANPHQGKLHSIEQVAEVKLEFMINSSQKVLAQQLIEQYHPYETPVYDFVEMTKVANYGLGVIGELPSTQNVSAFTASIKENLNMPSVRYIGDLNAHIKKVAIIGGAGIGYEYQAQALGADIFITGDIKHHEALDAKINQMNLLDINHYSEYVMKEGLINLLNNWLPVENIDFTMVASELNTDPYNYL
ncbi:Nif3-like dinuclear metal center hexameric protein [Staphylococcus arlettae]|uniref:Nif3-like dinuclear metal center hexameric protein n=1 Tax=Staphylococcus arlettae TaxID=29378 RepID=UPI003F571F56